MKIKNILYTMCFLLVLTSCEYLDVEPTGKVIPETVTDFRALMTSAYSKYPIYKNLLAIRSDEAFPNNGEFGGYDTYIDYATWTDNSPGMTYSYPWRSMYNVIFYTNSIIADVMGASENTTDDTKEQIMAEALLLRAYAHFELLNLYAKPYNSTTAGSDRGVPVATKIDIEQKYVPAKTEEVYTQILSDIKEGRSLLQVDDQTGGLKYRFSKKSAMALEARVRLYRSEWNLALSLAEELIPTCSLEDLNDATATLPYMITSKESILALDKTTNWDIIDYMHMLPNLMDKYELEEDLRVTKYFRKSGFDYTPNKCHSDNMKVTFRGAEIYLIAAEAAAHVDGQLNLGKTRLKELIKNRVSPGYYAEKALEIDRMNQQELLDEIADERARELALEGHRWFDLRRTTQPEIVKVYLNQENKSTTVTLQQNDPRYTIPFPKEATENNPNLRD